jgi:ribonuclease P protein component
VRAAPKVAPGWPSDQLRDTPFGLTRRHRLRGAAAFAAVFRGGRRFEASRLQLLAMPTTAASGRVGYVIGKKLLGRAVDRNRLKRMLREAIRSRRPAMNAFDLVIRLRQPCAAAELTDVAAEAATLLDGLLAGPAAPRR